MSSRIVGVALVRNEENFVVWSLMNAIEFCDEIIVLDNESTDRTSDLVAGLARDFPEKIAVHRVSDANDTHRFVTKYVGTPTWIFAVDGDEVYDPAGLRRLRGRIAAGEFDAYWRISGAVLHAVAVDLNAGRARGYRSPPSADNTKLFNFGALDDWTVDGRQRLHGGVKRFKPHIVPKLTYPMPVRDGGWERSDLRCLHLCFAPRTSHADGGPQNRRNPSQVSAKWHRRALHHLRYTFRGGYKRNQYGRGELADAGIASFGRPACWRERDRGAVASEAVLEAMRVRYARTFE